MATATPPLDPFTAFGLVSQPNTEVGKAGRLEQGSAAYLALALEMYGERILEHRHFQTTAPGQVLSVLKGPYGT